MVSKRERFFIFLGKLFLGLLFGLFLAFIFMFIMQKAVYSETFFGTMLSLFRRR